MTKSFEQLLYIFGAASLGKEIVIDNKINIEEIRKYAIEQGIWTIIYEKLQNLDTVSKYENEFLSIIAKSIRQTEYTSYILKTIEENGIECCLLKGNAIARLYHKPECRVSGDTDILINPKDEKKIIKILIQNGYTLKKRCINDHHLKAYHPVGGLIEVHVMLYSYITEQVVFDGINLYNEPHMEIYIDNKSYKTLGINDGLFYLTAHYIKHLINSGGGIRQMMDLLLYIEHYKKEINFDRYQKILKELRYEKLIKTIMSIGAKYFGFDYDIVYETLMSNILDDTEKGGIFGFSSDDRNGFYDSYCKKRTRWSPFKYNLLYILKSETSFLRIIFPSRSNMYKLGYNDNILFIAWFRRLYNLILKKISSRTELKKNEVESRMELMKKLNMIE